MTNGAAWESFERIYGGSSSGVFSDQVARSAPCRNPSASAVERGHMTWLTPVTRDVFRLRALRHDWDGYGAGPVREDVLQFVYRMLASIMRPDMPYPQVTPMSHEGVMLEWHLGGLELEIEIKAPANGWVTFGDNGWELKSDFRSLAAPLSEITQRAAAR